MYTIVTLDRYVCFGNKVCHVVFFGGSVRCVSDVSDITMGLIVIMGTFIIMGILSYTMFS